MIEMDWVGAEPTNSASLLSISYLNDGYRRKLSAQIYTIYALIFFFVCSIALAKLVTCLFFSRLDIPELKI